jgi:hypothetical protein
MTTERKLLGINPVSSGTAGPEAVGFDGVNDYLSRSSDMTGNTDSKTFTFSCWVYSDLASSSYMYESSDSSQSGFLGKISNSNINNVGIFAKNSSNATILSLGDGAAIAANTWSHILISCDMSDTSKRMLLINGVVQTVGWSDYTDSSIDFSRGFHYLQLRSSGGNVKGVGRLSNLFLDYTYRDLSIESNRRLFIDADGKPASGQAGLSPILYLPMKNADTAGSNLGSGGNFAVNGVLATAARGPNQDNCVASVFDGSADYLRSTTISLGSTSSITFSVQLSIGVTNREIFDNGIMLNIEHSISSGSFRIRARNSSFVQILDVYFNSNTIVSDRNYNITASFDLTNTANRSIFLNGEQVTALTWGTYTSGTLGASTGCTVGAEAAATIFYDGSMGELYLDTTYMDLATDNPFWDSDTSRPNSVRKVIEDTGVTPLIALPISGSNAGKNLGSGGDFTVNSGPFTGARGSSEYLARSMFCATKASDGLSSGTMSGGTSKVFSGVIAFNTSHTNSGTRFLSFDAAVGGTIIGVQADYATADMFITARTAAGSIILNAYQIASNIAMNTDYVLMYSFDMTDSTKSRWYVNGVSNTVTASTFTNAAADFNDVAHLASSGSETGTNGIISNVYFTTDYIDFSQETNRNMFVDQLGYPKDLTQQIEDGDIPDPLIYMKFEDPSSLGDNSGTGGDFTTVNGTVIAGADFSL